MLYVVQALVQYHVTPHMFARGKQRMLSALFSGCHKWLTQQPSPWVQPNGPPRLRVWNTEAGAARVNCGRYATAPPPPPSNPPSLRWSWIRKIRRRCTIRSGFLSVIMVTLQDKPFLIYIYLTSPSVWWALAWRWGWMFGGTVKRWWKGKECFVYPLQSLTLKLNVPIKFITTALLSLRCTLGWRESQGVGVWRGGVRRVVFIWKLDLIYLSKQNQVGKEMDPFHQKHK